MMHRTLWNHRHSLIAFLLAILVLHTAGCTYLRVHRLQADYFSQLAAEGKTFEQKHFVVHYQEGTFQLSKPVVNGTKVSGTYQPASYRPIYYFENRPKRYQSSEIDVLHEIHFYMKDTWQLSENETVMLPMSEVEEIRIIEQDTGRTVATFVLTAGGIVLIVLTLISLIAFMAWADSWG